MHERENEGKAVGPVQKMGGRVSKDASLSWRFESWTSETNQFYLESYTKPWSFLITVELIVSKVKNLLSLASDSSPNTIQLLPFMF